MNTNPNHPYGTKKDGTPKLAPGRKPSGATTKSFYVLNGQRLAAGRPSLETLRGRLKVTIPVTAEYDPTIHFGVRDPEDDIAVAEILAQRAAKEESKARAAQQEAQAAAKLVPAMPAGNGSAVEIHSNAEETVAV